MYTVGNYPSTTNLPTPPLMASAFTSGAAAFLAGLTSSYSGSNLGPRQIIQYGAFAGPADGDAPAGFMSAFPVLWGPGQRGMVAVNNIRPKWNGGNSVPPYGNGGEAT